MTKKNNSIIYRRRHRLQQQGGVLGILILSLALTACSPTATETQMSKDSVANTEQVTPADGERSTKNKTAAANEEQVELSLEEVVALGQKEADKYYPGLKLTEVHSYDNDEERSIDAGKDGKREWWNVNFANEDANYVSILTKGNVIVDVQKFDENHNSGLFELSDVKISTLEAVQKSVELGLRGGNPEQEAEWVSGFNFKLSYSSLANAPEDTRLFYEVIGISPDGNFARVDFDAITGKLLLAEEKIEHENNEIEWKKMN